MNERPGVDSWYIMNRFRLFCTDRKAGRKADGKADRKADGKKQRNTKNALDKLQSIT
jgi:hypothetical protein